MISKMMKPTKLTPIIKPKLLYVVVGGSGSIMLSKLFFYKKGVETIVILPISK